MRWIAHSPSALAKSLSIVGEHRRVKRIELVRRCGTPATVT
jgi:hypothetical protein